jgi:uncharacterized protein involved in exopolysaccharide biosynthesis
MNSRLIILYLYTEVNLDQIASEMEVSRQKWDAAQQALESYLPESKVNVLEVQLGQAKSELNHHLEEMEANQRIIRDARSLDARLNGLSASEQLPVGEVLSLIALQQRASGSISGTQFQLEGSEVMSAAYRAAEARDSLARLITALEDQNQELEESLPDLEGKISGLMVALENEQYKVDQLQQVRDRAKKEYRVMAGYYDETQINQNNQSSTAYSVVRAIVPSGESGQSTKVIVALAGIITGMIAAGGVFVYSWWTEEEDE